MAKITLTPNQQVTFPPSPDGEGQGVRLDGQGVRLNAWAVDGACSGNPGPMEYRCVDLQTGYEVFHFGPIQATNNIGEFLAIVHALALLERNNITDKIIYSDSVSGMAWVRNRKAKTLLERTDQTAKALDLVARAEFWLHTHTFRVPVMKWNTKQWGEIPADFNRKK